MKLEKCYLCSSSKYKIIHKGVRGDSNIDVYQCKNCGLVRLSDIIENADDFYKKSGMRDKSAISVEIARKDARMDDERRFKFTEKMIENKDIIDFGCGAGGYLIRAKNMARKVIGIELEDNMREQLTAEGIVCYPTMNNVKGKVDIITLFHVLEHLENPIDYLNSFKTYLNKNGVILIEVPNANDVLLNLYNSKSFSDFTYWKCHIYLYTIETLKLLARKSGFNIKFIRQVQRYSLANHLYWLTNNMPGGHYQWSFLENANIDNAYGSLLTELGMADTIIAAFEV